MRPNYGIDRLKFLIRCSQLRLYFRKYGGVSAQSVVVNKTGYAVRLFDLTIFCGT